MGRDGIDSQAEVCQVRRGRRMRKEGRNILFDSRRKSPPFSLADIALEVEVKIFCSWMDAKPLPTRIFNFFFSSPFRSWHFNNGPFRFSDLIRKYRFLSGFFREKITKSDIPTKWCPYQVKSNYPAFDFLSILFKTSHLNTNILYIFSVQLANVLKAKVDKSFSIAYSKKKTDTDNERWREIWSFVPSHLIRHKFLLILNWMWKNVRNSVFDLPRSFPCEKKKSPAENGKRRRGKIFSFFFLPSSSHI